MAEIADDLVAEGYDSYWDNDEEGRDWFENNSPSCRKKSPKLIGSGACPKCGGNTHIVKGKHGAFYGCDKFPQCNGSRDFIPIDSSFENSFCWESNSGMSDEDMEAYFMGTMLGEQSREI